MIYALSFRCKISTEALDILHITEQSQCYVFCNEIMDEFICKGPISAVAQSQIESLLGKQKTKVFNSEGNIVYIMSKCQTKDENHLLPAKSLVLDNSGFLVSYIQQYADYQYYSVLVFGEDALNNFKKDKTQAIEILSENEIPNFSIIGLNPYLYLKSVVHQITDLRLAIFKLAVEQGYFEIPRRITLKQIAADLGKSSAAIEKSFRSAENTIFDAILPYLFHYLPQEDRKSLLKTIDSQNEGKNKIN